MFRMSVFRILLTLTIALVLLQQSSCQLKKHFIKGLLLGGLLGHGKSYLNHESGHKEHKHHHIVPVPVYISHSPCEHHAHLDHHSGHFEGYSGHSGFGGLGVHEDYGGFGHGSYDDNGLD